MLDKAEVEQNLEAYRRMKDDLDRTYPLREFVAIAGGAVAAHSQSYEDVFRVLKNAGWETRNCVLVRIGDEPEDGDILHTLQGVSR